MMRAMRSVVVLLLLLLAGCAESPETMEGATPTDDEELQDSPDTNTTTDLNETAEEITPIFFVSIDGNLTEMVNGTYVVPADVNVTFDATNSTGNFTAIAWNLGNETVDGPIADFMFMTGNHTVNLTIMGAENVTVAVRVTAVYVAPPQSELLGSTPISFSDSELAVVPTNCPSKDVPWEFPSDLEGEAVVTRHVRLVLDPSWTGVALNMRWHITVFDPTGAQIAKATKTSGTNNLVLEMNDVELPGGTYTVRGEICQANGIVPNASYSVTGNADHYTIV